jgi:hypothetical protein
MEKQISGEEHQRMILEGSHKRSNSNNGKSVWLIILALVLLGLSFYGGVVYQKHHEPKTVASTNSASRINSTVAGGGGFRSGGARPIFGTVTAIDSSSISVQNSQTGTVSTLTITSSTTITDNGQSETTSDIQVGDSVAVFSSTTASTDASRILVNPSYGGGSSGSYGQSVNTE